MRPYLVDRFGRTLTYLRVSLIDRCNLRCFYCMPHGALNSFRSEELLTLDEIGEIIEIFSEMGIWKVRLTGGEPLLRKGIPQLISRIKGIPGIREVVMTTNGILLKNFASDLKKAGLDRVNVSLDTLDRTRFGEITGMDKLHEVLEGIQAAYEAGISPVKLNTVLMKGTNDGEIFDLVQYAIDRSFQIRFIEWMPTAGEIQTLRESRFLSVETVKRKIAERWQLLLDDSDPRSPARTFFIAGTNSKIGFISPLSNAFCGQCNRLRLKANGMLKTCLHGKEDLDLRWLLRSGASREEIIHEILPVVYNRPEEHFLNRPEVPHRDFVMTAVGG